MTAYLPFGLVLVLVLVLAVPAIVAWRLRPRGDEPRRDDPPSLHPGAVTPPRSPLLYPIEDTAPCILARQPEWDTQ